MADAVQSIETHHRRQSGRLADTQPCPWKVDHSELIGANEDPGLAVGYTDDSLSESFHLVHFSIFARTLVKVIMEEEVFIADRCSVAPHNIPQADWWSHVRCEFQVGEVSWTVDNRHHRIDFLEE